MNCGSIENDDVGQFAIKENTTELVSTQPKENPLVDNQNSS